MGLWERLTKRVLVTGGAGFLGSHLCGALLAEGHAVVCADNLLTGSMRSITHLCDEPPKVDYTFHFNKIFSETNELSQSRLEVRLRNKPS